MAKRNSKNIAVPNMMYIFCEGEKTEPYYIESFINDKAKSKSRVIKVPREKSTSPEKLVDAAIKKKKSSTTSTGDVFWVVYDKEDVGSRPLSLHQRAWKKAEVNGIKVAISCVCIEYFILLHFSFTEATYTSFDNLKAQSPLLACFKKLGVDDYDKASSNTYHHLKNYVDRAIINAKRVESNLISSGGIGVNEPYRLPAYTAFHHLLDDILTF